MSKLAEMLLALSREDLRAAEVLSRDPQISDGIIGFHAQQAAEKALKAWLTALGKAYPRTHDLSRLLYLLEEAGADVVAHWELLELNPFAVQMRYEVIDDEPLDHGVTLDRVRSLLRIVGKRLERADMASSE